MCFTILRLNVVLCWVSLCLGGWLTSWLELALLKSLLVDVKSWWQQQWMIQVACQLGWLSDSDMKIRKFCAKYQDVLTFPFFLSVWGPFNAYVSATNGTVMMMVSHEIASADTLRRWRVHCHRVQTTKDRKWFRWGGCFLYSSRPPESSRESSRQEVTTTKGTECSGPQITASKTVSENVPMWACCEGCFQKELLEAVSRWWRIGGIVPT